MPVSPIPRDFPVRLRSRLRRFANRCLIPLAEFCEWARKRTDLGDGKKLIKDSTRPGVPDVREGMINR